jgi:hypothetical protein
MIRHSHKTKETSTKKSVFYDVDQEPIIVSKSTLDALLQSEKPSDCVALYMFYYYTAKWQKTNQPRATNTYIQKKFGWGDKRVKRTKNILIDLGLIENVFRKNKKGKIDKWYIKVNFIWGKEASQSLFKRLEKRNKKTSGVEMNPVESNDAKNKKTSGVKMHPVENDPVYALSDIIIDALSASRYIEKEKYKKEKIDPLFHLFINKLPTHLQTQDVIYSIYEFFEYRKENKNKIQSKITVTKLVNKIKDLNESDLIDCIDNSISKGWTGLFPPYQNNKPTKSNNNNNNNNNNNTHPNTSINSQEEPTHYYNPYGSHCAPLPDDYEEDDAYDFPGILDH